MFRNLRLFGLTRRTAFARAVSNFIVLGFVGAGSAVACTTSWTDGNSNWSVAGNWSAGVPTSSSDACINNGSTVALDVTGNTGTLTVGASNVLNMGSNELNVSGATISNAGTISNSDGILQLGAGTTTLSGGGTLTLSNGAWVRQASSGLTLANQDNLIQGNGQIGQNGLSLDNQAAGTVNANTGTLTLNGAAVSNEGLLTATNSGVLQISTNVANTGNITGNGGSVLISSTINGGTLNATNSGTIGTNGTATLNGVTISSGTNYNAGSVTDLVGTITNNGAITSPNGFIVVSGGDVTLQGGGTVTLTTDAFLQQDASGRTLHNVDNTIQGAGRIGVNGLGLDNQAAGVINANSNGLTLTLDGTSVSNAGLLTASNGGTLQISTNVTNSGAGAITANGGSVLISSVINGGPLSAINGGTVGTNGTATLNGVTITSGTNYNAGSVTDLVGTITNNGAITSPNGFIVVSGGDVTLQGGGTVTLTTDAFLQQDASGRTLHNVDNTIQGAGRIGVNGLGLDNQAAGVINANSNGLTLTLDGSSVSNAGLLTATNGGTLQISTNVTNSGAGAITANGGSVLISSVINGGPLSAINGGTIGTNGTATLNGVTITSGTHYNAGSVTDLVGTITNNGAITSPNGFIVVSGGDVTLQGGGTVTLTTDAFIQEDASGRTLHNVDNTIQGAGRIGVNGLALDNQASGVINANSSGLQLTLDGASVSNAGLLTATNGGTLQISTTVNNSSNITANGGAVLISATVNGGTLNAINGGTIGTNGLATLNNLTISAGTNYSGGNQTNLVGTITNKGSISSNDEFLIVSGGDVTLNGGGSIVLQNDAFVEQDAAGRTLHNFNNVIEGNGNVGVDGLSLDNQAAGIVRANAGLLVLSGPLTNTGTLEADAGSTLHVTGSINSSTYNAGTLLTGTWHVISTAGTPGTIQIDAVGNTGGEIVKSSANIILDGPNANPIVDSLNKNALSAFQDNLAGGTFTVENGQQFTTTPNGGAAFQNEGSVLVADAASSFTTTTNYTQDGVGATTRVDGTLTAGSGSVNIDEGTLLGSGTVNGDVFIGAGGTLAPGDPGSPKAIRINGNYSQSGTLDEMIGGAAIGQFGQTLASGSASIGGSTLDVSLVNGFSVAANTTDQFVILTASSPIIGQFASVDFLNPGGDVLSVDYSHPDEVILDISGPSSGGGPPATPEPAEFLPLAGILAAVIWKFRRKRATTV